MRKFFSLSSTPLWVVYGVAFVAAAAIQLIFWTFTGIPGGWPIALVIAALLVSALAAWISGLVVRIYRGQSSLQQRLSLSEDQLQSLQTYLRSSLRMDAGLFDAANEEEIMEITLGVITDLTGARGASFVPLDEWGQSLPAYTYGKVPPPLLKAWTEHLASNQTRETCRACQTRQAMAGASCPLMDGPFSQTSGLFCFPMERGERLLGMINLYLPGQPALTAEMTEYLGSLMNEAALGVESIRLRNRELNTLRQLQTVHTSKADLHSLLSILLEGLQQVLEADGVQLQVRSSLSEGHPTVQVEHGQTALFDLPEAAIITTQIFTTKKAYLPDRGGSARDRRFGGIPLTLPDGKLVGAILLAGQGALDLDERKVSILTSVADQALLLIERDREMLSLEYRTVIQERARLAREIHDGLAQTLAFLKLQAAQMQIYLNQGNLTRLGQVLKQNYDTLAEAYLDTRQAIDDLRITPQEGMVTWLEQLLSDFESSSGIPVERSFQLARLDLSPEVQAQLVRIVQEALNNIRKHAHASNVLVSLRVWNGDLVLEVRDDGQGFSPEDIPGLSQYGLLGMRERSELIGADFQVISKPHQGTVIRLSLPVRT